MTLIELPHTTNAEPRPQVLDLAVCFALVLAILLVYFQVINFAFLQYDDPGYVSGNAHVQAGLTLQSVVWSLTAVVVGNWMPLTLLSHMLDCQLFGLHSGMHHVVNVAFHIVATLLLYLLLRHSTRSPLPSLFVAATFALHPLHIQSVAWVAERKDVLSACFFFLALYCYVLYSERPSPRGYGAVLVAFTLGLLAKPMLVTFPFVLMLFDIWPLRRAQWMKWDGRLLVEKLPLFALAAGSCIVTYFVQGSAGAFQSKPVGLRIGNALISYVTYLVQMIRPTRLAVFYPFPKSITLWESLAALSVLAGVSAVVLAMARTRPYLAVGWFWYLGMLVPVIGLVQVGAQAHADRYTYLPLVGVAMAIAWGAADLAARWPWAELRVALPLIVVCATVCMLLSWREATYWRNSETLFQHAIDVTPSNWLAEGALGEYLMEQPGRRAEAVDHLRAALRIEPTDAQANNNLGMCMVDAGLCKEAIPYFEASLRLRPLAAQPLNNIGVCLMKSGNYADAIPYLASALRTQPDSAEIQLNLGMTISEMPGRTAEAIGHYEKAIQLRPAYAEAHYGLGLALASMGRLPDAIRELEVAQSLRPSQQISNVIAVLRSRLESATPAAPQVH